VQDLPVVQEGQDRMSGQDKEGDKGLRRYSRGRLENKLSEKLM
jgi:hypothetical protein